MAAHPFTTTSNRDVSKPTGSAPWPGFSRQSRGCIFFVLALHKHYSDVLRSCDLLPRLAEKYTVVVLNEHYNAKAAEARGLFQHPHVTYLKIRPRYSWLWNFSDRYIRTYFVRELDHLVGVQLYDYKHHVWNFGHRILSELGALLPKHFLTAERMTRIEQAFVQPTQEFSLLVRQYQPSLIVTAASGVVALEAEAIVFARKLGIPTAAVNLNVDYPHYQTKKARRTDYITVWNSIMKQEVEEYMHYPQDRVFVAGCLRYDHYFTDEARGLLPSREEFLLSKGLDPSRKTIVWSTTTTFFKHIQQLMRALLQFREQGRLGAYPNILVRLHPSGFWKPYQEFVGIPGVCIDFPGRVRVRDSAVGTMKAEMDALDLANLTATLKYADAVLFVASTMTIEAALFDKPSVAIGFPKVILDTYRCEPNNYFITRGAIPVASGPEEMCALISQYLLHPEFNRTSRERLAADYVYFRDGLSAKRTADFIDEILQREETKKLKT